MKLALAAGGTGGHVFPARALAEEARRRGWSVLLLTDARGLRYADGFPVDELIELRASNPTRQGARAKLDTALALAVGTKQARSALRRHAPDVTVGFGGYPSAPAMFAAKAGGRRHGVHEQNAVLGRVNRRVAPKADFVAHGFERLDRLGRRRGPVVQTGNPVRDDVLAAQRPYEAPGSGPVRLLVFGGSQGARLFADAVPEGIAALPDALRHRLVVTHQVGADDEARVRKAYAGAGVRCELAPFFGDLPTRVSGSHLVLSRAGASSVTELSVLGRPSILVPLGIAMDDHQTANAEVLSAAGAAEVIAEPALTGKVIAERLANLLSDPAILPRMAAAANGRVPDRAATRLADLCEGLLGRTA